MYKGNNPSVMGEKIPLQATHFRIKILHELFFFKVGKQKAEHMLRDAIIYSDESPISSLWQQCLIDPWRINDQDKL